MLKFQRTAKQKISSSLVILCLAKRPRTSVSRAQPVFLYFAPQNPTNRRAPDSPPLPEGFTPLEIVGLDATIAQRGVRTPERRPSVTF